MESFNPHEYVPRRVDAPAKFLLWDFDLVASGIAGLPSASSLILF
ncbi:MAG: hypothetical protein ACLRW2_03665 [Parasutterella excrementihominis]